MPPWCVVGSNAQLGKAIHICIVLNLQMCTGRFHTEFVTKFLPSQFYTVENCTGRLFTYGMSMEVQFCLVEQLHHLCNLLLTEGGSTSLIGIYIGSNLGSRFDSQGSIHEYLKGMYIQVLAVELLAEALYLLHHFLHLLGVRERNASVDIYWQLALFVQLVQTFIDTFVERFALRKTCVEDNSHTGLYRIIDPTQEFCIDLLICYF